MGEEWVYCTLAYNLAYNKDTVGRSKHVVARTHRNAHIPPNI